jgi:hypothetical protein
MARFFMMRTPVHRLGKGNMGRYSFKFLKNQIFRASHIAELIGLVHPMFIFHFAPGTVI